VTYCHSISSNIAGYPGKKVIPQFSGSFLNGTTFFSLVGSDISSINGDGGAKSTSQISHVSGILLRVSTPKLMVKVSYMELYP
jgi:hypothetical protein